MFGLEGPFAVLARFHLFLDTDLFWVEDYEDAKSDFHSINLTGVITAWGRYRRIHNCSIHRIKRKTHQQRLLSILWHKL
jgi:hypothetical protein